MRITTKTIKELSYNNWLDLDGAFRISRALPQIGAAVIKHNNPCGAASADKMEKATKGALEGDPESAFGSIIGLNGTVDAATADVLTAPGLFIEAKRFQFGQNRLWFCLIFLCVRLFVCFRLS